MSQQADTRLNRGTGMALNVCALIALATIAIGYVMTLTRQGPRVPDTDEGALAHIFQLSVALAGLTGLTFLATADWTRPAQNARRLVLPGAALFLAFAGLYLGEHYFWAR